MAGVLAVGLVAAYVLLSGPITAAAVSHEGLRTPVAWLYAPVQGSPEPIFRIYWNYTQYCYGREIHP